MKKAKKETMTSKYKGVYYNNHNNKYAAQIYINGVTYKLGYNDSEEVCNMLVKKISGFLNMYGERKTIEYLKKDWQLTRHWLINNF